MRRSYSITLHAIILPIADKVMRTKLIYSYRQLKRLQSYSSEEIKEWQNIQLAKLVEHAFNHCNYYNRLFKNLGLLPSDIKSIEDLAKLPALQKEMVRDNFSDLLSDNLDSIPCRKAATGGSTGDPLIYYSDNRSWSMSNANTIINWEKVGYNYGDPFIALGSTSLFVNKKPSFKHEVYYSLKNKIALNGINMSEKVCKEYVIFIKKKKVKFIYGYASAIYMLAKYVLEHRELLMIRACFSTSEVLTDQYYNTIKEAFGCDIMDCYGANDSGISAFAHEKGLFNVGYNCLVRIENPDKNGLGPALLTDLFNFAMPFINYKIGDEIQIDKQVNKGQPYNGQIINKVLGRSSDIINLENGHSLTGPGFTILFKDLPVEHYCIKKTGINTIECSIVKLPGFTQSHENLIKSTFINQMGPETFFSIAYTHEIPLAENGKRKYFSL